MVFSMISAAAAAQLAMAAPVSIADPKGLVTFLQSKGYKAELDLTDDVPTIISGASGWKHVIVLQGCKNNRACQDLLFKASWTAETDEQRSMDKINAFNREKRFARTYLDAERDPVIEMDVIFSDHQMDSEMLDVHLENWDVIVAQFAKHIGVE